MNNSIQTEKPYPAVYQIFRDHSFHWGLFLPAMFYGILAIIGISLNTSVCWVTIKYSSLRHNTCVLIAMEAFFRILYQMDHFNFFIIALSGINFYPIRLALPIESYSVIGANASINQIALLSLDRLFSVLAPLFYRQMNKRIYIFCHFLVNASITAYYFAQLIPAAIDLPEWPCTGQVGDIFDLPNVGPIFFAYSLIMICISIMAYFLVAILIRLKTEISTESQQKIYHSLLLIVLVNVFAYFFYFFVHMIYALSLLPLTPLQFWYTNLFTSKLFLNIGVISNAPILYFNSVDYRNAYKKEFKKLIQLFKRICGRQEQSTNKIIPISNHIIIK